MRDPNVVCAYCDEDNPHKLRAYHDGGGYIPPDYICEECFTGADDGPCWDDLPWAPVPEGEYGQ